ncbi:MAG: hypothetical protein LAP40_09955 [Acidobacteriia bacterium]|nr:hypothetical protein [Terriglobia bacterium]
MRRRKLLAGILGALLLAYGVCTAALYAAMHQTPERFGAIMAKVPSVAMIVLPFEPLWMSARRGSLRAGDAAPDFSLPRLDKSGVVRLSAEWRERPVVLVFGSYT